MRGKTIQIFLTDGSPRGIKLAEVTSNVELAIFIPRTKINEASSRKEISNAGIYFLFGEGEVSSKPVVYIGQSRNCFERIKTHDQKKEFWNYAIIIISKTKTYARCRTRLVINLKQILDNVPINICHICQKSILCSYPPCNRDFTFDRMFDNIAHNVPTKICHNVIN